MDDFAPVTPAHLDVTVYDFPFLYVGQASSKELRRPWQAHRNSSSHPIRQPSLERNPVTYKSFHRHQQYCRSKLLSRILVFFSIHLLFCFSTSLASAAGPAETITLSKPLNIKGEEDNEETELKIHRHSLKTPSEDALSGIELSGDLSDSSASGHLEVTFPELDEFDIETFLDEIELQSGTFIFNDYPRNFSNNEFLHALVASGTAQFYANRVHVDFQRMLYSSTDKSLYAVAKEATLVKLDGTTLSLIDSHTLASQPQASIYCQQSAGCKQRKEINVLTKTPDKPFVYYCSLHYEDHPRLRSRRALTSCVVPNPDNLAENLLMWDNVYYTSTDPYRPPVILAPKKKPALKSADGAAGQSFLYVAGVNSNLLHIGRLPMPDWASGDINWEGALFSPKRSVFIQEPATIVISFETETAVYFLLREKPSRYSVPSSCFQQQRQVVSRLVRVCQGDQGGLRGIAEHYFGTMAKADLFCQSEVTPALHGSRRSHFVFDHAQSAFWDEDTKRLYVTFTAGEAAPRGSAVCVYDLQSIERVFKGPIATFDYSYQQTMSTNQGNLRSNPFPDICERFSSNNLTDKELSLGQIGANFMYRAEIIRPLFGHAVAMSLSTTWTAVIGYQLPLLTNSVFVTSILWLASADQLTQLAFYENRGSGTPLKPPVLISTCVLRNLRVGRENNLLKRLRVGEKFFGNYAFSDQHLGSPARYPPFDIDDSQKNGQPSPPDLPDTERINSILREGDSIFLGTTHAIFRFPTDNCAYYTTKEACLESNDPHCGWSSQINHCLSIRSYSQASNLLVATINRRPQCPSGDKSRSTLETGQSGWSSWQQCNMTNTFQSDEINRSLKEPVSDQHHSCLCRICLNENLCNFGEQQVSHCKVPGVWSQWSDWSPCKEKLRYRTRVCLKPLLAVTATTALSPSSNCFGPSREEEFCLIHPLIPEEVDFKGLRIEHAALREDTGRGFIIDRNYLLGVLMGSFVGILTTLVFMFLFIRFCHRLRRHRTTKRPRPLLLSPHGVTRRVSNMQLERHIRDSLLSDHPMYANPSPMNTSVQSANFPRYNYILRTSPSVSVMRSPDSSPSVDETSTTAGVYDRLTEDK